MKNILILVLFTLLTVSCQSPPPDKVGGPCEYKKEPFTMIVTEIRSTENNTYDVLLNNDTSLEDMLDIPSLDDNFLKENDIKEGKTLTGTKEYIIKGTCTPIIYTFDSKFVFP